LPWQRNWDKIGYNIILPIRDNRKKLYSVYHTVNGNRASKTAKNDKGYITYRAPCQNVNVLLSNTTFIIFVVFDARLPPTV